jgi:hypothetical protein
MVYTSEFFRSFLFIFLSLIISFALSSCGPRDIRADLEAKTKELRERLYPEKEIEVVNIDDLLNNPKDSSKLSVELPEFLRKNIGIFYRSQVDAPREMSLAGQTYLQHQTIYTNSDGNSYFLRFADLKDSPAILRNKRAQINSINDFSNPIETREKLVFKQGSKIIGYIYYNKDDSQGFVNIIIYGRYFLEIETRNKSSEELLRLLIFHLPFDLLEA